MEKYHSHLTEEYWVHEITRHDGWTTLPVVGDTEASETEQVHLSHSLPESCLTRLHQLCKGDEVNRYAFLFTALARVLSVYAGKKQLLLSVPVIQVREQIYADETLFWAAEVDGTQPFKTFFLKNRETLLQALGHTRYNSSHVWQKLAAKGMPLPAKNRVCLAWTHTWTLPEGNAGIHITAEGTVHLHTWKDSYGQIPAQNLLDSVVYVLQQMLDDPGKLLGDYHVYEPLQLQTWLAPLQGEFEPVAAKTFLQVIENQIQNDPNKVALLYGKTALTYQTLHQKARRLAHLIRERYTPQPSENSSDPIVIAVLLEHPEDLLVSMLGIWEAGGAYLVLPASASSETQAAMLHHAGARLLITDSQGMFQLHTEGISPIAIDIELPAVAADFPVVQTPFSADKRAVVCYEEDQPDTPIFLTHRYIQACMHSLGNLLNLTAADNLLYTGPFHRRVSMYPLWLAWGAGATLVTPEPAVHPSVAQLEACVRQHPVRVAVLDETEGQTTASLAFTGSLQTVVLPMETTDRETIIAWEQRNIRVVQWWGTQTPLGMATLTDATSKGTTTSLGTPLANTRLFLLDAELTPVPAGITGEWYVEIPEANGLRTALSSPFAASHSLFKTGEKGRREADGTLTWLSARLHQAVPSEADAEETEPLDHASQLLIHWCQHILGVEKVRLHHDFFSLGGDSIKAIDLISKLNRNGYELDMRDIFRHRTIRDIAAALKPATQRIAEQAVVTGNVPLTPIQRKFFSFASRKPQHFNQAFLFYSEDRLDEKTVKEMVRTLQTHHDALRMSYRIEKNGIWQVNRGVDYPVSVTTHDFRKSKHPAEAFLKACNHLQESIHLAKGPLLKIGLFRLPDGDRLLLTLHHLVVDIVSWKILFEDMALLLAMYQSGQRVQLPPKTHSYKLWAEKLTDYLNSDQLAAEKSYWQALENTVVESIPKDFPGGSQQVQHIRRQAISLTADETEALQITASQLYQVSMNEVVLTALALGVYRQFGVSRIVLELERHGREPLFEGVDVSRTVGWFTSVYPFVVEIVTEDPAVLVKEVQSRYGRIPNGGIGYGLLRYMPQPTTANPVSFHLKPQISFNFLGEFQTGSEKQPIRLISEPTGDTLDPQLEVPYELDISGMIIHKTLTLVVSYSDKQYRPETIQHLLDACKAELLAMCTERQLTPTAGFVGANNIRPVSQPTA